MNLVSSPKLVPGSSHSFSFFDFDNTLYKGEQRYVILDFPVFLHSQALFDAESLVELESLKQRYLSGKIDRTGFALGVLKAYYKGLKDKPENDVLLAAENFWRLGAEEKWFSYSLQLVQLMNKHTVTVLISGSPHEVLSSVCKKLGFVRLYATKGLVSNGCFTGSYKPNDETGTYKGKAALMQSLQEQLGFDPERSFAFGDAESDVPLLQAVSSRNAFLIGGDARSRELARQNGWNLLEHDGNVFVKVQMRVNEVFINARF